MRKINNNEMQELNGGAGLVSGVCAGIGASSVIYAIGAFAAVNWWNPVGWVTVSFLVADAACIAYGLSD